MNLYWTKHFMTGAVEFYRAQFGPWVTEAIPCDDNDGYTFQVFEKGHLCIQEDVESSQCAKLKAEAWVTDRIAAIMAKAGI